MPVSNHRVSCRRYPVAPLKYLVTIIAGVAFTSDIHCLFYGKKTAAQARAVVRYLLDLCPSCGVIVWRLSDGDAWRAFPEPPDRRRKDSLRRAEEDHRRLLRHQPDLTGLEAYAILAACRIAEAQGASPWTPVSTVEETPPQIVGESITGTVYK